MLHNVQALRALAALLVVVVHLETLGAAMGLGRQVFGPFAVGVDLFFVISGFIMVHTTSGKAISPGAFMLNRLLRIAPLYWVLTIAVFVLAALRPALLGATQADWGALAQSLAFIPYERADGTVRPILFVGWSLNLEMAFYALFAVILGLRDVTSRIALGIILLIAAVALGRLLDPPGLPALRFLTQPVLLEFAAGMAIGWLHPLLPASRYAARWAVPAAAGGLVALVMVAQWPLPGGWPATLLPACAVVLAALVAEKGGLAFDWPPVRALGDASFALYLVHPFVTQAWTVGATRLAILDAASAPLLMILAMGCAVAAGLFVHRRLERPLGHAVRAAIGVLSGPGNRARSVRTAKVPE